MLIFLKCRNDISKGGCLISLLLVSNTPLTALLSCFNLPAEITRGSQSTDFYVKLKSALYEKQDQSSDLSKVMATILCCIDF